MSAINFINVRFRLKHDKISTRILVHFIIPRRFHRIEIFPLNPLKKERLTQATFFYVNENNIRLRVTIA